MKGYDFQVGFKFANPLLIMYIKGNCEQYNVACYVASVLSDYL